MATRTELSLPEAQVERIERDGATLRIHFSQFFSFVSLTGSSEQTQWRQAGVLTVEQDQDEETAEQPLPEGPLVLAGGDVHANAYVYRDRVPLPLQANGRVGVTLRFEHGNTPWEVWGVRLRLDTVGERRYVGHVR